MRPSLARQALVTSAAVGTVGIVFIVLMYGAFAAGAQGPGMAFGWVNDVCVLAQFLLLAPAALMIRRAIAPATPRVATAAAIIGLAGITIVVVFQALLVAGVMTFEQQIGYAGLGFLLVGVWLVTCALTDRRRRSLPFGLALSIAAALYVGLPLLTYRVARWAPTSEAPSGTAPVPAAHADQVGRAPSL